MEVCTHLWMNNVVWSCGWGATVTSIWHLAHNLKPIIPLGIHGSMLNAVMVEEVMHADQIVQGYSECGNTKPTQFHPLATPPPPFVSYIPHARSATRGTPPCKKVLFLHWLCCDNAGKATFLHGVRLVTRIVSTQGSIKTTTESISIYKKNKNMTIMDLW